MKLVPNLHIKEHYVIHYNNLKQYVALGMKVTKVLQVLKFRQETDAIYLPQYQLMHQSNIRFQEGLLQADEQCCLPRPAQAAKH